MYNQLSNCFLFTKLHVSLCKRKSASTVDERLLTDWDVNIKTL